MKPGNPVLAWKVYLMVTLINDSEISKVWKCLKINNALKYIKQKLYLFLKMIHLLIAIK